MRANLRGEKTPKKPLMLLGVGWGGGGDELNFKYRRMQNSAVDTHVGTLSHKEPIPLMVFVVVIYNLYDFSCGN